MNRLRNLIHTVDNVVGAAVWFVGDFIVHRHHP